MLTLDKLENLVVEVEVALLALEDTIDAREAQEKQLEQRFEIASEQVSPASPIVSVLLRAKQPNQQ